MCIFVLPQPKFAAKEQLKIVICFQNVERLANARRLFNYRYEKKILYIHLSALLKDK